MSKANDTSRVATFNATVKRATEIIDDAVAQAKKYNVPRRDAQPSC